MSGDALQARTKSLLRKFPINLFIPYKARSKISDRLETFLHYQNTKISAIIPTYKPTRLLLALVVDLLKTKQIRHIVIVDDASPPEFYPLLESLGLLAKRYFPRLTLLKNNQNLKRAGAVNQGFLYLNKKNLLAKYILVLDDDVKLDNQALLNMLKSLEADPRLGAVCTQARVLNRHKNLLTRLQGIEYFNFNFSRVADEGYLQGPLIMHGLASLIKCRALLASGGYDRRRLLEDYDLTVKLKELGYRVALCPEALAWTKVPESFKNLWLQRVRWQVGGLEVVKAHKRYLPAILPDLLSHFINISLLGLVVLSFFWLTGENYEQPLFVITRTFSLVFSLVLFLVQIFLTYRFDKGRDGWDIVIRLLILPELYYTMVLSLIVWGSYLYFCWEELKRKVNLDTNKIIIKVLERSFAKVGFTRNWGTK